MLSSARTFSKQVLSHRTQIQQQTKSQLRNQHNGPRPKDQQQTTQDSNVTRFDDDLQRQGVLDKMRQENRERKKRWREMNDERNKDNDLRCRVNKRANQLYGAHASADKERWVGEEFERRQQRRREKETRKRPQEGSPEVMLTHPDDAPAQIKCPRIDEVRPLIPTGFGSYASLPTHQVRAAHDFWKSAAEHHALEATDTRRRADRLPVSLSPTSTLAGSPPASMSPPAAALSTGQRQQEVVWLPPLSSIVPEEFRKPLLRRPSSPAIMADLGACNHNGHVAPAAQGSIAAASHAHLTPTVRHMRPWEEEACCADQPMSGMHVDGYNHQREHSVASPLSSSHLYWPNEGHYLHQHSQRDDVTTGLSEAAFSLMSLSGGGGTSPEMY
ncbi:hypothetical protein H4S07_000742 [Coemansia furcata]|uniref:Uncharacterized protein n=1 Tax=Coemansia furcata TaxID=417177 RepID=A0ACC1LRF8_9FUNG|nr:hypothetical protein H4S07_000742 [Coemansia furcata]